MGNEGSVDLYFDGEMGHWDPVGSGSSIVTPHFHSPFCQVSHSWFPSSGHIAPFPWPASLPTT